MCAVKQERQAFTSPTTLRAKVSFLQAIERSSSHVRNPCPQMMRSRNTQAADDSLDGVWHPPAHPVGSFPRSKCCVKESRPFLSSKDGAKYKTQNKTPIFLRE